MRSLCADLIYEPVRWLILSRALRDFPSFKWSFLLYLHQVAIAQWPMIENGYARDWMTPETYLGFPAMLGADALFLLDFSGGAIDVTTSYRALPSWPRSLAIVDHWKNRTEKNFKQGDVPALIREIAAIAGFTNDLKVEVPGCLL